MIWIPLLAAPAPGEWVKGAVASRHSRDMREENQLWFDVEHPRWESGIKCDLHHMWNNKENWASLLASDGEGCSVLAGGKLKWARYVLWWRVFLVGRREHRKGSELAVCLLDWERKFLSDWQHLLIFSFSVKTSNFALAGGWWVPHLFRITINQTLL